MRLREIQKVIEDSVPAIQEIKTEDANSGGNKTVRILEYTNFRRGLLNLLETGLFEEEKFIIYEKMLLPSSAIDSFPYGYNSYQEFYKIIQTIKAKADGMLTLISQNLHAEYEDSNSLIISLPDRELSIEEFSNIINSLKETFKIMKIIKEFNSDVVVDNFDVGSKWFVLGFAGKFAVDLFGKLVNTIQRMQVGIGQVEAMDKHLESIGVEVEMRNSIRQAQITANSKIYEDLTKKFLETNNLEQKAEIISQMSKVTANIDQILKQGVGFEAAVTASNDVAKTFPPLERQKQLDQVKALESIKSISQPTSEDIEKPS